MGVWGVSGRVTGSGSSVRARCHYGFWGFMVYGVGCRYRASRVRHEVSAGARQGGT
jgi:hypothetical protein